MAEGKGLAEVEAAKDSAGSAEVVKAETEMAEAVVRTREGV